MSGREMINRFYLILLTVSISLVACGSNASPESVTTPLHEIQGAGTSSPMVGKPVSVSGIVTGDFQSGDADTGSNLNGFFIQEEQPDASAETSDGLFIADRSAPETDVNVGDLVLVEGEIQEYFGETQVKASSVAIIGSGFIEPVDIQFPFEITTNSDGNAIADLERYEGMLVRVPQSLTVVSLYTLARYGDVQLAADGRWFQFTNQAQPDVAGYTLHKRKFASATIMLDDGQNRQNITPVKYLFPDAANSPEYSIRIGDTVAGLTGNVRYSRGSGGSGAEVFRLVTQKRPAFTNDNPRPASPPAVGGDLKVASFNLLNFFTTINTGKKICGPGGDSNCRGADSDSEFSRQREKVLTALTILDADIVGLIELENNPVESIQSLVDGLNDRADGVEWSFVDSQMIGDDAIRVGMIYKTKTVSPIGRYAVLDNKVDARFLDTKNRPVLLQTFEQRSNHERISIAVGHLKSKGSPCAHIGDPNLGDGQANCNRTRTSAVEALADWLATDPTASDDPDFLYIGDPNAYSKEDPVTALQAAGFVSLLEAHVGPEAYSFQYEGQSGALDQAFASASLNRQVTGTGEWHINADEPPLLDYNLEFGRDAVLFGPTLPFRASDHDPLVIGITLQGGR